MAERALRGKRTMHKQIPAAFMQLPDTNEWQSIYEDNQGWVSTPPIDVNNPASFYYETYFDLSGYTLDDLTIYPEIAAIQDPGRYTATFALNGRLNVIDIVSQERLDVQNIIENYQRNNSLPGSFESTEDWTQIVMGRWRLHTLTTIQSAPEVMTIAQEGDFSSMEPTAVEKLWIYRIVIPVGIFDVDFAQIRIPPARFIIRFESIEESELNYMMRLKRSYELGTLSS